MDWEGAGRWEEAGGWALSSWLWFEVRYWGRPEVVRRRLELQVREQLHRLEGWDPLVEATLEPSRRWRMHGVVLRRGRRLRARNGKRTRTNERSLN